MAKDFDKQDKRSFRRRPGGKDDYQWGMVDNDAQEDMIEPVVKVKSRSRSRKPNDVGTMYAALSNDGRKRKCVECHAEDYPDFVAEVEEGEIDPFAVPSYGALDVSNDIMELAGEMLAEAEKRPRKTARAPKRAAEEEAAEKKVRDKKTRRAAKDAETEKETLEAVETKTRAKQTKKQAASRAQEVKEDGVKEDRAAAKTAKVKKIAPKAESKTKVEAKTEPQKAEPKAAVVAVAEKKRKVSFLEKIKQAVTTGHVTAYEEPVQPAAEPVKEEPAALTQGKMRWLVSRAKKTLEGYGYDLDSLDLSDERGQIYVVADLLEASIKASEQAQKEMKRDEGPEKEEQAVRSSKRVKAEKKTEQTPVAEGTEVAVREARGAKTPRVKKDREAQETEAREERPAKQEKKSRREEEPRQAYVEKTMDDFDDPIDYWESIAREGSDELEADAPAAKAGARRRSSKGGDKYADDNYEEFDAAGTFDSKKKSERNAKVPDAEDALDAAKSVAKKRRGAKENDRGDSEVDGKTVKTLENFGKLHLSKLTLKALYQMGYSEPTPIQAGTIPSIQTGVDLMGQAKTGTGKTAAFMIPIIEGVAICDPGPGPKALVVSPTRELAVQIKDEGQKIAKYRDLSIVACYGGKPLASQVERIRKGVDILVGTPGRIIDLVKRNALTLDHVRWVVLDEADRMLDIGFRPDVEKILSYTPRSRQTLLFSATLAPPVVRLAKKYMKDPEQFDFSEKDVSADTIEQFYITVDQDRKFDALVRLLEDQKPRQAIVFCRTKRHVDIVGRRLSAKFGSVESIHGDLAQSKRDRIMRDFRAEQTKILVATDVVGRGIDVSSVSHIVNYDVPQYCDDYVHRVGRAGRMGREGVAFTLVTAEEGAELTRIEIRINKLLQRMELPNFEAYTKPTETKEPIERKHVYGQATRRFRNAL